MRPDEKIALRILSFVAVHPNSIKSEIQKGIKIREYNTISKYVDLLRETVRFLKVTETRPNQGGKVRKYYNITQTGLAFLFAEYTDVWNDLDNIANANPGLFELCFRPWKEYDPQLKYTLIEFFRETRWKEVVQGIMEAPEEIAKAKVDSVLDISFLYALRREPGLFLKWLDIAKKKPEVIRPHIS